MCRRYVVHVSEECKSRDRTHDLYTLGKDSDDSEGDSFMMTVEGLRQCDSSNSSWGEIYGSGTGQTSWINFLYSGLTIYLECVVRPGSHRLVSWVVCCPMMRENHVKNACARGKAGDLTCLLSNRKCKSKAGLLSHLRPHNRTLGKCPSSVKKWQSPSIYLSIYLIFGC